MKNHERAFTIIAEAGRRAFVAIRQIEALAQCKDIAGTYMSTESRTHIETFGSDHTLRGVADCSATPGASARPATADRRRDALVNAVTIRRKRLIQHFAVAKIWPSIPPRTIWTEREHHRQTLFADAPKDRVTGVTMVMDKVVVYVR